MPATGLKIVGTRACLPCCNISSSFQNSMKTSGHRGNEFLEFWLCCWRVFGRHWRIFHLMMHQMFSIGERSGLQAGQFSIRTLLLRSHAVVISAVCGFALSCWNRHHLEGSICCSKTFIYLSAFIVPSKTCKLPIPYALIIRDAGFWPERWWHAGRSSSSLAWRTQRPWFPTRMSNLDSSNHRTLFHFETVHFKWALAHRTRRRFWTMFTNGFLFLNDRALVGICRWHGGLCLPTVVSGSIPGPI